MMELPDDEDIPWLWDDDCLKPVNFERISVLWLDTREYFAYVLSVGDSKWLLYDDLECFTHAEYRMEDNHSDDGVDEFAANIVQIPGFELVAMDGEKKLFYNGGTGALTVYLNDHCVMAPCGDSEFVKSLSKWSMRDRLIKVRSYYKCQPAPCADSEIWEVLYSGDQDWKRVGRRFAFSRVARPPSRKQSLLKRAKKEAGDDVHIAVDVDVDVVDDNDGEYDENDYDFGFQPYLSSVGGDKSYAPDRYPLSQHEGEDDDFDEDEDEEEDDDDIDW
jgi:hypothetical protein